MRKERKIRFNRLELAGAFGDIGTDFPLMVAMILAAGLHAPSVLIVFGCMQLFTGFFYKMPMPAQPLKAMAALVISQKIVGTVLMGAGLAIGLIMLVLTMSGLLDRLAKWIPKAVIRGVQLGLGISLCMLSFKEYISSDGLKGYILAGLAFVLVILLLDSKKYPASIVVLLLGVVYALVFKVNPAILISSYGVSFPKINFPSWSLVSKGLVLLALPQIPLSIGNSILATKQMATDLFPERRDVTVRKIGLTYSLMNLIIPFFSGVPCCHGSGGMMGHYTFGGRTGGSVIIYGCFFIVLGVFFGEKFSQIIAFFPLPVLGIILLFEGISLILLIKDVVHLKKDFVVTIFVGLIAFGLPYGFIIAMIVGVVLYYVPLNLETLKNIGGTFEKPAIKK